MIVLCSLIESSFVVMSGNGSSSTPNFRIPCCISEALTLRQVGANLGRIFLEMAVWRDMILKYLLPCRIELWTKGFSQSSKISKVSLMVTHVKVNRLT